MNMHWMNRDQQIQFHEKEHQYSVLSDPDSHYISVTTWVKHQFAEFDADEIIQKMFQSSKWQPGHKYWGQTAEEIKEGWEVNRVQASSHGTALHRNIETFMKEGQCHATLLREYQEKETKEEDNKEKEVGKEWTYFLHYLADYPDMVPYRMEWVVFDETLKIAGSIDMVYQNPDGSVSIYDWKRSKEIKTTNAPWKKTFSTNPCLSHLEDTNFWHYALQLNLYKVLLERNYGKQVSCMKLVRLHPDAPDYELLEVPDLSKEMAELFPIVGGN